MHRRFMLASVLFLSVLFAPWMPAASAHHAAQEPAPPLPAPQVVPETLPLLFEPNAGRYGSTVQFLTHSLGGAVTFSPAELTLTLPPPQASTRPSRFAPPDGGPPQQVRVQFAAANPAMSIVPDDQTPATVTIATSADSAQWQQDVPTYAGDYLSPALHWH